MREFPTSESVQLFLLGCVLQLASCLSLISADRTGGGVLPGQSPDVIQDPAGEGHVREVLQAASELPAAEQHECVRTHGEEHDPETQGKKTKMQVPLLPSSARLWVTLPQKDRLLSFFHSERMWFSVYCKAGRDV